MAAGGAPDPTDFPPFLSTAPVFFVSVHGAYDLEAYPEPFRVPEGTLLIETVDIGETCYTTMDEPLWNLLQGSNRAKLLSYMKGRVDPTDSDKDQELYLRVFKNVHVYEPGDLVYNRILIIGGGMNRSLLKKGERTNVNVSPFLRKTYANMGFYKFDAGAPADTFPVGSARTRILPELRDALIADEDNHETYESMIDRLRVFPDPKIIVFGCCGVRNTGTDAEFTEVERVQQAADQKFMSKREEYYSAANNAAARAAKSAWNKGGRAAWKRNRKTFLRGPSEFKPETKNNDAFYSDEENSLTAPVGTVVKPKGVLVFRYLADGTFQQVTGASGKYFDIAKLKTITNKRNLYVVNRDGSLTALSAIHGGSRSRTNKRVNRSSRSKARQKTRRNL